MHVSYYYWTKGSGLRKTVVESYREW